MAEENKNPVHLLRAGLYGYFCGFCMHLDNVKTAKNNTCLGCLCPFCCAVASRGKFRQLRGIQVCSITGSAVLPNK